MYQSNLSGIEILNELLELQAERSINRTLVELKLRFLRTLLTVFTQYQSNLSGIDILAYVFELAGIAVSIEP